MRRSIGSRALTLAALLGRGAGLVSIQWLTRNSGASSGPRLGLQERGIRFGSVSWKGSSNEYGVSWAIAYASWYQGTRSNGGFSAIITTRPPSRINSPYVGDSSVGHRLT